MLSPEILKDLLSYVDDLNDRYPEILEKPVSDNEKIMVNALSLSEESWELSDQIVRKLWFKFNRDKHKNYTDQDLEDEAADVLICFLMLLRSLWITDMDEIIKRKIKINNKRGY